MTVSGTKIPRGTLCQFQIYCDEVRSMGERSSSVAVDVAIVKATSGSRGDPYVTNTRPKRRGCGGKKPSSPERWFMEVMEFKCPHHRGYASRVI